MTRLVVLLLAAWFGLLATPSAFARTGPEIGTYQGGGCEGKKRMPTFERWLGRKVHRVLDGVSPDSWQAMVSTAGWVAGCWEGTGYKLSLSVPILPRDSGKSTIAAGATGEYDRHFHAIAAALVKRGHADAIIRLGPEFNAPWFHWNSLKEPDKWVEYWRRIVTVMRSVPGQNFQFDWCPAVGQGVKSPEPAYPGDEYVDIIGADVYNANFHPKMFTRADTWRMLRDAQFGLKWHARFAAAHGKPMSYPEWGTGTRPDGFGGGDDPEFIAHMAEWIHSNNVLYHVYWDYPASDYNGRLSDGSKPEAGAAFVRLFGGKP